MEPAEARGVKRGANGRERWRKQSRTARDGRSSCAPSWGQVARFLALATRNGRSLATLPVSAGRMLDEAILVPARDHAVAILLLRAAHGLDGVAQVRASKRCKHGVAEVARW